MHLRQLAKTANFRLAAAYAALFSASVVVLGAVVFLRTTSALEDQAKARIESEANGLQNAFIEGGLTELLSTIKARQRGRVAGGLVYAVFEQHGERVYGTLDDLPVQPGWTTAFGPPDGDEPSGELEKLTVFTVRLSDLYWVSIGDDFGRIEDFGNAVLETFAWMLALTLALAIAGGLFLSAKFLGRIGAITRTAEAIIDGDIHRRIPRRATNDDLDRLGATLNRMLDRIVALMDALRQVSSNIAHELRTPLSHVRQMLEVMRSEAQEHPEIGPGVERAVEETEALLNIFSALLRIAQIESGTRKQGFRDVDLSALVESIVQTYSAIAEEEGRTLRAEIGKNIHVNGDAELLVQMLVNLVENAIRHAPGGTHVHVSLTAAEALTLVVSDNGPGIPIADRERVFKRFERLEPSRRTPGSGLGLSIVQAIAELHEITPVLESNDPGLRAVLRFHGTWSVVQPNRQATAAKTLAGSEA